MSRTFLKEWFAFKKCIFGKKGVLALHVERAALQNICADESVQEHIEGYMSALTAMDKHLRGLQGGFVGINERIVNERINFYVESVLLETFDLLVAYHRADISAQLSAHAYGTFFHLLMASPLDENVATLLEVYANQLIKQKSTLYSNDFRKLMQESESYQNKVNDLYSIPFGNQYLVITHKVDVAIVEDSIQVVLNASVQTSLGVSLISDSVCLSGILKEHTYAEAAAVFQQLDIVSAIDSMALKFKAHLSSMLNTNRSALNDWQMMQSVVDAKVEALAKDLRSIGSLSSRSIYLLASTAFDKHFKR